MKLIQRIVDRAPDSFSARLTGRFGRLSALLVTTAALALAALPADAAKQTRKVRSLGEFQMPAGDESQPAFTEVEIRTRIPMGVERLRQEKQRLQDAPDLGAPEAEGDQGGIAGAPAEAEVEDQAPETAPDSLTLSTSCTTNVATGFAPSDIHGAAGPSVLVVVTNVDVGVDNKGNCALISRVPLTTLFADSTDIANQTLFDPRVLYDRSSGRFLVTAESRDNRSGNTDQYQYFAVSTSSAASAWNRYQIPLSQGSTRYCKVATNSFWDYPSAGKSANRWFITANDFAASGGATGAVLAVDKAPTLTGGTAETICWNNLQFNIAPPIVLDGLTSQSVFLYPRATSIGRYNHAAGATPGADTLVTASAYTIPSWSIPPDAVQPNGQRLDSLDGRFQSASIQSRDRLWNVHAIASGSRPVVRWYRLRRTSSTVLSTRTYSGASTDHLFNPSFVTNSGIDGSPAFLTLSRTIPSNATAGRAAMMIGAGPNTTTVGWSWSVAATSSSQFDTDGFGSPCNSTSRGSCRWGDYSSTTVDPDEAGSGWGFNQLIEGTNQFNWFTVGRKKLYNLQSGPIAQGAPD
jgi:hypothetical protein